MSQELEKMTDQEMMQAYSNACAQLGNTQTLIHELKLRVDSLNRDIDKLSQKYKLEVEQSILFRRELEKRGANAGKN